MRVGYKRIDFFFIIALSIWIGVLPMKRAQAMVNELVLLYPEGPEINGVELTRNGKAIEKVPPIFVHKNDVITTDGNTRAVCQLGSRKLYIDINTRIRINRIPDRFQAIKGQFVIKTTGHPKEPTIVETRSDKATIMGSIVHFCVVRSRQQRSLDVKVLEGKVQLVTPHGTYQLTAYESYVGGKVYHKTRILKKTPKLGEGHYSLPGSQYIGGPDSWYDAYSGGLPGIFSGSVFPRLAILQSASVSADDPMEAVRQWIQNLDQMSGNDKLAAGRGLSIPSRTAVSDFQSVQTHGDDYYPLTIFGFTVAVANLYQPENIGKLFHGQVQQPHIARQCYGFHRENQGNNAGDKVEVVYLGNGRVDVKNLATGYVAHIDVKR